MLDLVTCDKCRFEIDAELKRELKKQRKAFIKKFGRNPVLMTRLLRSRSGSTPTHQREGLDDAMLDVLRTYKKTGRLLTELGREQQPPEVVAEWDAAIEEYFLLEDAEHEA